MTEERRSIARLALALDRAVSRWLASSNGASAEQHTNHEDELNRVVSAVAQQYSVLGAALGVVNPEDKTFQLKTGYGSKPNTIFPYESENVKETKTDWMESSLLGKGLQYSDWAHNLFSRQRSRQTLIEHDDVSFELPEFFRELIEKPYLYVSPSEIQDTLISWARLWQAASLSNLGHVGDLDADCVAKSNDSESSIFEWIKLGFENTSLNGDFESTRLPEFSFLFAKEGSDLAFRSLLADSKAEELHGWVAVTQKSAEHNESSANNESIFESLIALHGKAKFPVLPYLALSLLYDTNLCHAVLPLHRTHEFKVGDFNCGVVFLGTIAHQDAFAPDIQLMELLLLLRIASEPILDRDYYGGFVKQHISEKVSALTLSQIFEAFAHQIKWIAGQSEYGWIVDLDLWNSHCRHIKKTIEANETGNESEIPENVARYSKSQLNVFSEKLKSFKVAPAPELYSALHSTLLLWTFTKNLDDLFLDKRPKSLAELFDVAAEYARNSRLLSFAKNKNISASYEKLLDVWQYDHNSTRAIRRCELGDLKIKPFSSFNEKDKNLAEQHLSGLLRLLVIGIEDFFVHGKDDANLNFNITPNDKDILLTWTTTGVRTFPKTNEFLGMSGSEVFEFVALKFMRELFPEICHDKPGKDPFIRSIRLRRTDWLV